MSGLKISGNSRTNCLSSDRLSAIHILFLLVTCDPSRCTAILHGRPRIFAVVNFFPRLLLSLLFHPKSFVISIFCWRVPVKILSGTDVAEVDMHS